MHRVRKLIHLEKAGAFRNSYTFNLTILIKECFRTTQYFIWIIFFFKYQDNLNDGLYSLKLWFAYRVTLAGWQEDQWWDHFRKQRLHYPSALWTNLYTPILLWKPSLVTTSSWLKAKSKWTEQLLHLINLQHSISQPWKIGFFFIWPCI